MPPSAPRSMEAPSPRDISASQSWAAATSAGAEPARGQSSTASSQAAHWNPLEVDQATTAAKNPLGLKASIGPATPLVATLSSFSGFGSSAQSMNPTLTLGQGTSVFGFSYAPGQSSTASRKSSHWNMLESDEATTAAKNPFAPKASTSPATPMFGVPSSFSGFGSSKPSFNSRIDPGLHNSVFVFSSGKSMCGDLGSTGRSGHFWSSDVDVMPTQTFGVTSTSASSSTLTSLCGTSSSCTNTDSPAADFGSSKTTAFGVSSSAGLEAPAVIPPSTETSSRFGQASRFGRLSRRIKKWLGLGLKEARGTRITPYTATPHRVVRLVSICAMPEYKDKTHDQLRYEDYQLGERVCQGTGHFA